MNRVVLVSVYAAILFVISCDRRPEGVLSDKEMVRLIADMEVAETYLRSHNAGYYNDSIRDSAVKYVLDRHGLTKAEFDSTMMWYGRNIDKYHQLFPKVEQELAARQRAVTGKDAAEIDVNDFWPYSRHFCIAANSGSDNLAFSIPVSGVARGERFNWKMRLNSGVSGNVVFGVEYENGTIGYCYQSSGASRRMDMRIQTDSSQTVKRVFGSFRLRSIDDMPLWVDSISLQSQPFDSTQYYRLNSQRTYYGPRRRTLRNDTVYDKTGSASEVSLTGKPEGSSMSESAIRKSRDKAAKMDSSVSETKSGLRIKKAVTTQP